MNEAIKENLNIDLPELKGTVKQVKWATTIRKQFAYANPESELLLDRDEAQYWIENIDTLIGIKVVSRDLPDLTGTEAQIKWANAIRLSFLMVFPKSEFIRSQTTSKFWIENRTMFDSAVLGFNLLPKGDVGSEE